MAWSDEEDGAGLLSITPVPQQKTKFAPTPRRRNTVSSPTLKKTESESSMLKSQIKKNNTPENSPSEKHTIQSNANESPTILASSWKRTPEAEEFHQRLKTAGELTALQEVLQKPLAPALAPAPARTASEASTKANTPPVPARRDHDFSSPVSPPVVTRRARASTISGSTPPPSNYPYPFPPPPPPQMKSQKGAHKKLNLARFKLLPRSGSVVESDEDGPIDAADLELLLRTEATIQKRIEELKEKEKELLQSCSILSGKTTVGPSVVSRKKKDTRKVNTREISICERLGAGFSGAVVYSCIVDGWVCAMKQLASENKIEMENFEKEMSLLYRLPHHPNIIRYLFHSTVNGKLCLFMTRHASTLQKVIHTKFQEKDAFSETAIRSIAFKIVSGIKFLHGNQIIHRDIKTENIYVTPSSDGELKEVVIADFDTATRTGTANVPQSTIGTLGYMAPEVFNNKQLGTGYTFTADIFSFGMVLYSLITLREPFYHITNPFQIYEELLNNAQPILEEEQINRYSPELIELHRACININPQLRPNSSDILEILQNTSSSTERILSNSR